jgi:hypothetical protein
MLLAAVVLLAEVFAIAAGLNGNPDRFEIWLVSGVIVAGTSAGVMVLFWPWLRRWGWPTGGDRVERLAGVLTALLLVLAPLVILVDSVEIVPPDPTAELAALDALDKEVSIRQADGLLSAASASRFHRCIAAQRLATSVGAAELTGWYFRRPSGDPVLPSDSPGSRQARLPSGLADLVAIGQFLDNCPSPQYKNPFYKGDGTSTPPPSVRPSS